MADKNKKSNNEESPKTMELPYTQEQVDLAAAQENAELAQAQNAHLTNRVVVLRAEVNRLQAELNELVSNVTPITIPDDRKSRTSKRAAAKRPSQKKASPKK